MSEDIKGVFVRLPLSDSQREQYLDVINSGEPLEAEASALESGLLAIGAPVTGGELPTEVVLVREHRPDINLPWVYLKTTPSDQDASEYELEVERLLTHEQAQAQIAALEAEVVRLRRHLGRIDSLIMGNSDPVMMFCGIHASCTEALKGGAP